MPDQAEAIGIFWLVPGRGGRSQLLIDSVPLSAAEPYGDCLTHPRGHYEVWEQWKELPARSRTEKGIPHVAIEEEYETFPRGRVVFHRPDASFWIYADRRLQHARVIAEIKRAFGLEASRCIVKSDAHYR